MKFITEKYGGERKGERGKWRGKREGWKTKGWENGDGGKEGKERDEKEEGKEGENEGGSIFIWGAFRSALSNDGAALWRYLHLAVQALYPCPTTRTPNAGGPRAAPLCGDCSVRAKGRARAGPGGLRAGGAAPAPARPLTRPPRSRGGARHRWTWPGRGRPPPSSGTSRRLSSRTAGLLLRVTAAAPPAPRAAPGAGAAGTGARPWQGGGSRAGPAAPAVPRSAPLRPAPRPAPARPRPPPAGAAGRAAGAPSRGPADGAAPPGAGRWDRGDRGTSGALASLPGREERGPFPLCPLPPPVPPPLAPLGAVPAHGALTPRHSPIPSQTFPSVAPDPAPGWTRCPPAPASPSLRYPRLPWGRARSPPPRRTRSPAPAERIPSLTSPSPWQL